jgi:hypothetical protein
MLERARDIGKIKREFRLAGANTDSPAFDRRIRLLDYKHGLNPFRRQ